LIDDLQVLRVAVTDNGEPLVDAASITALAVDPSRAEIQQLPDDPFHVRAAVPDKFTRAQASLPGCWQMQVKEGWRPVWVQQRLWDLCLDQLQASRPGLGREQARRENARFVAPSGSAPRHSTGGAVDVVLLHDDGRPADMGWGFNQPGDGFRAVAPVTRVARRHRDVLVVVMDAGFVNYPAEWRPVLGLLD
jgi:zinc D-Ala-D-Ala dipeptidase